MAARTLPVCGFPGCQKRCWLEQQSGKVHPFCGITHAGEAKKKGMPSVGAGHQNRTCQLTGCSEPASFDDRRNCWHDFCSRSHASAAIASGQQWVRGGGGTGASTCRFPGCRAGVYRNQATGKESNFCSKRHRDSSTGVPSRNPYILLVFRVGTTSASGFTLSALAPAHRDYVSIRNHFDLKWIKHGAPMVLHVLKLEVPAAVSRSFFNYSQTSSNVKRRFHGTGCSARCNFFADLKGSPCEGMDCRVCSICTRGFKINGNVGTTARRTSISLRYGEGLYFSSVSGKANDYAAFSEKNISGRRLRCMFVANVCAGKAYSTMQGSLPQNMCPPANYDSVVGEAGQALNHDELVVYKEEAALPTHLIVYSLP